MKRLIVNADDFGFNREITDGIVQAHQQGIVTSTTLMVNMPAAEYALKQAENCPNLSVGLHLNLTLGRPVSDPMTVPSLLGKDGEFLSRPVFFKRANLCRLKTSDLKTEILNQLNRMQELGATPTHVDSHHHATSCIQPFLAKLQVLRTAGIHKIRTHNGWYRGDRFAANLAKNRRETLTKNIFHAHRLYYKMQHSYARMRGMQMPDERLTFAKIVSDRKMSFSMDSVPSYIAAMRDGVTELSCHPGHHSDDPMDNDTMRASRPSELAFLTDPELKEMLEANKIQLMGFREL